MSRAQLKSLYKRLGGEEKLTTILQDFYQRMSQDILVGFFFSNRNLNEIAQKQKEFMMTAMGLQSEFTGRRPQEAHQNLPPILSGHFDRRIVLLKQTLKDHHVPDEDIRTWTRFENSFRKVIVSRATPMVVCFWMTLCLILSTPARADSGWVLSGEEEGITIFKKEVIQSDGQPSPVFAFKGEGIVQSTIEILASVLFDTDRANEWASDLKESKILKWLSPETFISYSHFRTPPLIMQDRDFVSEVTLNLDPTTHEMTFQYRPTTYSDAPSAGVRGELIGSTFRLKPVDAGKSTQISGEIHCDPKGSVPKWLVNWYQKSWPIDTLKGLRKQVKKPNLTIHPTIQKLFNSTRQAAS